MPSTRSNPKPPPDPVHEWSFAAIGTSWWIGLYEPIAPPLLADLQRRISNRIEAFDAVYSRFRADSLVTRIAQQAGEYQFPDDADELFSLYRRLYELSAGQMTPLIGQLLSDAGYDADYSLKAGTLVTSPAWDDSMNYDGGILTVSEPLLLDFGAAGKGFLVDIIADIIATVGITTYCVDGSGDMCVAGIEAPLKIGLENPDVSSEVIGVADLQSGALCGSAGNRRAWGNFHHIIDPKNRTSPRHIKAIWVMAETALMADGLATALFFVEPTILLKQFNFEHVIVYADGTVTQSKQFPAIIFTERNS